MFRLECNKISYFAVRDFKKCSQMEYRKPVHLSHFDKPSVSYLEEYHMSSRKIFVMLRENSG